MNARTTSRAQRPLYPEDLAFVVQFQDPAGRGGDQPGRVEHVRSGKAGRFECGAELLEFIAGVLANVARPQAEHDREIGLV